MYKVLFSILLCCCISVIHAQDKRFEYADSSLLDRSHDSINAEEYSGLEKKDILSDTTIYLNKIMVSPDSIAAWKNDKRFAYMKNIDSLLKQKQQEEQAAYNKQPRSKPNNFFWKLFSSGILQLLFWAVAVAFVVLILYKLFFSSGIFKRDPRVAAVNALAEEELIATVADYDRLILQSVNLGDHRMAVRYLFLKNLARLADKEYLQYSADKTNYQYVQEIPADKKNEFSSLVLNYEYIWYGNFPLSSELYTGIEKKFKSFYNKIQ